MTHVQPSFPQIVAAIPPGQHSSSSFIHQLLETKGARLPCQNILTFLDVEGNEVILGKEFLKPDVSGAGMDVGFVQLST